MTLTSNKKSNDQIRSYLRTQSVVFLKTKEAFGGLSNMAAGYPLCVNGILIRTSEALYQACRFPHLPDLQRLIINQASPMTAKMKGKPHRHKTRSDWFSVRVKIMRWCLRVKLAQNWQEFGKLLLQTGNRSIVEESRKDEFWGAKPLGEDTLVGMNVLGRLLMELREEFKSPRYDTLCRADPLPIKDFLLYGQPIEVINATVPERESAVLKIELTSNERKVTSVPEQLSFSFKQPICGDQDTSNQTMGDSIAETSCTTDTQDIVKNRKNRKIFNLLVPYSENKESGDVWLGRVPSHWSTTSLGAISLRRSNRNRPDLPLLSVLREKGVVLRSSLAEDENHNFIPDDLSNYRVAHAGDLVINKMKAWQGSVGIAPTDGIVSPAYFVFKLNGIAKEYAHRLLRSRLYADYFARASDGVRIGQWDLSIDQMKRIPVVIPPQEEQYAVAHYLLMVDRRINRFIRNRRRLIELLNEQKQAIINRAVTRGLDPDVRLKPSGVEWLGDVPEHWEVRRGKYLFREVESRSMTGEETHLSMSQRHGLIRSSAIEERRMMSDVYIGGKLCEKDDLVLNRLKAHLGVFALATEKGLVSPDYTVFRAIRKLCPAFYEYFYRTPLCRVELRKRAKGIVQGFWRLYTDDFYDIPVPVPPAHEQEMIVEKFTRTFSQINVAIENAHREISLIREYRTRLISDVVTGKVDVRGLAPADAEEIMDAEESIDALDENETPDDEDSLSPEETPDE